MDRICVDWSGSRCVMMTSQNGQTVVGPLHQMRVAEYTYRVQTLCQMLRIRTDDSLRGIRIQNDDDQTAFVVLCGTSKRVE